MHNPHRPLTPRRPPGLFPPPGGMPLLSESIGFDITIHGRPDLAAVAAPTQPVLIVLYTVPDRLDRVEIVGAAVMGAPRALWFNGVSWEFRTDAGSAQEFVMGSSIAGAAATARDAGLRWAPYGSLARVLPTRLLLRPGQRLHLAITGHQDMTTIGAYPVSVWVRLIGQQFFRPE